MPGTASKNFTGPMLKPQTMGMGIYFWKDGSIVHIGTGITQLAPPLPPEKEGPEHPEEIAREIERLRSKFEGSPSHQRDLEVLARNHEINSQELMIRLRELEQEFDSFQGGKI